MKHEVHTLKNQIYKDSDYGYITKIFYVLDYIQFGIDSNENWIKIIDGSKAIIFSNETQSLDDVDDSVLSLLEINFEKFKEDLGASLETNNISASVLETFPYESIVMYGLSSK